MFWYVRGRSILPSACRISGDHSCLYGWGAIPIHTPRARRQPAITEVPPRPGPKTATVCTIPNSRLRTTCFIVPGAGIIGAIRGSGGGRRSEWFFTAGVLVEFLFGRVGFFLS